MSEPHVLRLEALLADAEKPALISAAQQLCQHLGKASGETWTLNLRWFDSPGGLGQADAADATLISLLPFMASPEPIGEVDARVSGWLADLESRGVFPLYLMTVFRHVGPDADPALRERARRLNLLAVELSHRCGVFLVDIDKIFAHVGARQIETDYRLAGRKAAETGGYAIVAAILAGGLDNAASPQVQEKAIELHGPLSDIGLVVGRRLAQLGA